MLKLEPMPESETKDCMFCGKPVTGRMVHHSCFEELKSRLRAGICKVCGDREAGAPGAPSACTVCAPNGSVGEDPQYVGYPG